MHSGCVLADSFITEFSLQIQVQHPAAKSMIEISRTQDEEVGDGTTSVIILGELYFLTWWDTILIKCIEFVDGEYFTVVLIWNNSTFWYDISGHSIIISCVCV